MKFDQPKRRSSGELSRDLSSNDPSRMATAIIAAALHDHDRLYVESLIVEYLEHDDPGVRGASAIAAGHVARIHRSLAVERIVPLIKGLLNDPRTSGKAQDALDDIQTFLEGRR